MFSDRIKVMWLSFHTCSGLLRRPDSMVTKEKLTWSAGATRRCGMSVNSLIVSEHLDLATYLTMQRCLCCITLI